MPVLEGQPSAFPLGPPVIAGANITVSVFLNNPARVQRSIENLTFQRFIADYIFNGGPPATGGAVVYDQVQANDLFLTRDVQPIAPGEEFPLLTSREYTPLVAVVRKWGGEVLLTDEAIRRDNRNLLARQMTRLRNTIIRKVDALAVAALQAAPIGQVTAGAAWINTTTGDPLADLAQAKYQADQLDMGYELDTVLLNPQSEFALRKSAEIRNALPRESNVGLLQTGNLPRLVGFEFIMSNRVALGIGFTLERGTVGGISDEVPMYARPIRDDRAESTYIHGARVVTPYVTEPLAAVQINGL